MSRFLLTILVCSIATIGHAQRVAAPPSTPQPYQYEDKPDAEALRKFFPAKAPAAGPLIIRPGDRLAILGDSITEQRMYSRMIETYLTVCYPQWRVRTRQFGWSGEKVDGLLARLDQDVLRFDPSVATICYGMNDARYRPLDWTNARRFKDQITELVDRLRSSDCRVVLGTPGCTGKIASWVKAGSGTLDEHNLALCALRDICIEVAASRGTRLADIFWPMYVARIVTTPRYDKPDDPYHIAGKDGVHPGWAGHTMMAYAFLRAMGIDGDLGTITIDASGTEHSGDEAHVIMEHSAGKATIQSRRYPFCATGAVDDDQSIRSGMSLVPFQQDLNRLTLRVVHLDADSAEIRWGDQRRVFSAAELTDGILLADAFPINPFSEAFAAVDEAVLRKQTFERDQIKSVFHGEEGRRDLDAAADKTEAERRVLVNQIQAAFVPVRHTIEVVPR